MLGLVNGLVCSCQQAGQMDMVYERGLGTSSICSLFSTLPPYQFVRLAINSDCRPLEAIYMLLPMSHVNDGETGTMVIALSHPRRSCDRLCHKTPPDDPQASGPSGSCTMMCCRTCSGSMVPCGTPFVSYAFDSCFPLVIIGLTVQWTERQHGRLTAALWHQ